jgi:hypothetical protein
MAWLMAIEGEVNVRIDPVPSLINFPSPVTVIAVRGAHRFSNLHGASSTRL